MQVDLTQVLGAHSPPHSLEQEQAALGAALISRDASDRVLELLEAEDYYLETHRKIHAVIAALVEKGDPVDVGTVPEELQRLGQLDQCGGLSYIGQLAESVPTAAHVDYYARQVSELSQLRRLIAACSESTGEAYERERETLDIVARAQERLERLGQRKGASEVMAASTWFQETVATVLPGSEAPVGVATGFPSLDRKLLGGPKPGNLVIVAGRPSMGKTAICNEIAANAAKRGVAVLLFSLEMTRDEMGQRFIASEATVDCGLLIEKRLSREDWPKVPDAVDRLRELPLHIYDDPETTVHDIRAHTRRMIRKHGVGLVIIDQLQTIHSPKDYESENLRFTRIAYGLKAMARALKVPVVLQAQLNRKVEERTEKRPQLADLRDSGSLENAADVVIALYRPAYYQRKEAEFEDDGTGTIEVGVLKHRNGPTGWRFLEGALRFQQIRDLSQRDDAPPERHRYPEDLE